MAASRHPFALLAVTLFLLNTSAPILGQTPELAEAIRQAASAEPGQLRPLPLAAHWNTGTKPDGFGPDYQLQLLDQGFPILPWFALPVPGEKNPGISYYRRGLQRAAQHRLPITFISTQWERLLSVDPRYVSMPADTNPNVVSAAGKIDRRVSPAGAPDPWRDLGQRWSTQPDLAPLQEIYPDPPRILLLSNNEHAKLRWKDASHDVRLSRDAAPSQDQLIQLFADGWKDRYTSLFAGMRGGWNAPAWRTNSLVVGYNAFIPPSLGRWPGWVEHSLTLPDQASAWTSIWQGASLPFYTHPWDSSTDFRVWSPQVEGMNWRATADSLPPNNTFWLELSTWDGNRGKPDDKRLTYQKLGQSFDPERYEGMVQFGLWLIQPRTLREFRAHNEKRSDFEPYFQAVLRAVRRVHTHPQLREYWQRGQLVPNPTRTHPYQANIPTFLAHQPRWFGLTTSLDPPGQWKLDTILPVFALAHQIGDKPNRRWLVYAHAPNGPASQVTINIPDFSGLQVDVPRAGAFWVVQEQPPSIEALDSRLPDKQ
jgi:hypothetical protein